MGVDFSAYAAIGVKVDREKLFKSMRVKAFPHDFGEDMKFDPKTGKALWKYDEIRIDGLDDDKLFLGKFPVCLGTPDGYGLIDHYVICATEFAETGSNRRCEDYAMAILDLEKLVFSKADLIVALEPIGLWDANRFGLHAILYCSY